MIANEWNWVCCGGGYGEATLKLANIHIMAGGQHNRLQISTKGAKRLHRRRRPVHISNHLYKKQLTKIYA